MRVSLTTLLDLVGIILVIGGTLLIDWRLTIIVVGCIVLAVSYLLARVEESIVARPSERTP